jgi:hypothetical protein
MKKGRLQDYILIFLFMGSLVGVGVLKWMKHDLHFSTIENRALAQPPKATKESLISGKYTKQFEQYFNDQIPGRQKMIEANATVNKDLLKQNVVRNVYVNDDGYLLTPNPKEPKEAAQKVADRINKLASEAKQLGATTYFALAPNKPTTMEDKFPSYYPSYGNFNANQLLPLINSDAHPIDLRKALKPHLKESNLYFYTDHHWKAKAALYGYQSIINTINETAHTNRQVLALNDFTWKEEGRPFYGSDARETTKSYAKKSDTITVATPKFKEKTISIKYNGTKKNSFYFENYLNHPSIYVNRYQAYVGGDYAEIQIVNPNVKTGNLLILKDSYANAALQFFARDFHKTYQVDLRHYNAMKVTDFIKKNNIETVILLHNVNSIYVTPALINYDHPGQGDNQ